jgi:hypothetical protein
MVVEGLGISSHNVVAGIGASWRDASTAAIVDDIDDNRLRPTDGVVGDIVAYLHGEFWEQYQGVFGISRHIFVKSLLDPWIKDHRKLAENDLLQEAVDGVCAKVPSPRSNVQGRLSMRFSHTSDCRDDDGVVESFQYRGRMFSLYTPSFELVGSLRWNNIRVAGVV